MNLITSTIVDYVLHSINHQKQELLNNEFYLHAHQVYIIVKYFSNHYVLQKCPKLVLFHNGTFADKGYQGKKEINVVLHTLNQRSRVNPKVKRHKMYCWQLQ